MMKELKEIPQKRMPEVLERAARIQQDEELSFEADQEKNALVQAAQEVGISAAHVQRAAQELQQIEEAKRARRRKIQKITAIAALLLALVVGLYWAFRTPTAPAWEESIEAGASAWELKTNPESKASLRFESSEGATGLAAVLSVERLAPPAGTDKDFFVNLVSVPKAESALDLSGHSAVHVRLRGEGLQAARIDLQASADERWRSPKISLSGDWTVHDLPLSSFERQTKDSTGKWKVVGYEAPQKLQSFSVKVGYFVNDASARGTLWIDELSSR